MRMGCLVSAPECCIWRTNAARNRQLTIVTFFLAVDRPAAARHAGRKTAGFLECPHAPAHPRHLRGNAGANVTFLCLGIEKNFPTFISMQLRELYHNTQVPLPACLCLSSLNGHLAHRPLRERKPIDYNELNTGIKKRCKSLRRKAKAVVTKLAPGALSPQPACPPPGKT